jgi:hypothetical protein
VSSKARENVPEVDGNVMNGGFEWGTKSFIHGDVLGFLSGNHV